MAFASMLRRASSSVLPRAIRAAASPRTFRTAVSTVLSTEKQCLGREIARRGFTSPLRFSTAAVANKDNLVRVLEAEIECAEEPCDSEVPAGFPFEIEDIDGERTITLTRKFEGETIKVEVDMLNVDGDEEEEEEDSDNNNANENNDKSTTSIPMVVTISKGSRQELEFGITAFPDEISVDSLSIKNPSSTEEQLPYEGPDFGDLDENLQKAFLKYLEIRGINPKTTNFLIDYMGNKDSKEYVNWLNNIKKFVQK
ncbi:unnamed protein product [Linum trigynum]|uniref:Mitochondrial glycoprotein n=1 Tax=Linum trigynum TaxID=586398 RepID=A0AAV2DZB2_9ROSI